MVKYTKEVCMMGRRILLVVGIYLLYITLNGVSFGLRTTTTFPFLITKKTEENGERWMYGQVIGTTEIIKQKIKVTDLKLWNNLDAGRDGLLTYLQENGGTPTLMDWKPHDPSTDAHFDNP